MIETYWNEMFGLFKDNDGKFKIPGLPEPLMSAHFGEQNVIGPSTGEILQSFTLCVLPPLFVPTERLTECEPLAEALLRNEFWDFQEKHNSPSCIFMKRLLPFLISLPQQHYHFYLNDSDGICASAIVGESMSCCFFFNLAVKPIARKQGLSKLMLKDMRGAFFNHPTFYWTIHPWFTFDSIVNEYHVLKT